MRIIVGARISGKTTECIKELLKDLSNTYLVVYNTTQKMHICHNLAKGVNPLQHQLFHDHVVVWHEYLSKIRNPHNIIIDEADAIPEAELTNILHLGRVIMVATTLDRSYDNSNTIIRRMMKSLGYEYFESVVPTADLNKLKQSMSKSAFDKTMNEKFRIKAPKKIFVFR